MGILDGVGTLLKGALSVMNSGRDTGLRGGFSPLPKVSVPKPNYPSASYNHSYGSADAAEHITNSPNTPVSTAFFDGFLDPVKNQIEGRQQAQGILNRYAASAAPSLAELDNLTRSQQNNIAMQNGAFEYAEGAARKSGYLDLVQNNLDFDINGVNRSYIPQLLALVDQQRANIYGRYNTDRDYLGQQYGFNAQARATDQAGFANQRQQIGTALLSDKVALRGEETARGGLGGGMAGFRQGQLQKSADEKVGAVDVEDRRSGEAYVKANAKNKYDLDSLSWDLKDSTNSIDEKQLQLKQRGQILDLEAQKLGVTRQQLAAALDEKLANMGLQQAMSIGQLMDGLASNSLKKQEIVRGTIQAAMNDASYQQYMIQGATGRKP